MTDYANGGSLHNLGSSTTTSRKNMKSPPLNKKNIDEMKHIKKKYSQVKQILLSNKQHNSQLQKRLKEMSEIYEKREKQINKKQSIHDVLLEQISVLKSEKQQRIKVQKTTSPRNYNIKGQADVCYFSGLNVESNADKNQKRYKVYCSTSDDNESVNSSSGQQEDCRQFTFQGQEHLSQKANPKLTTSKVGGYFGSVFK